jgi:hypothetical protein
MIKMSEIVTIVRANMPYDTGFMYANGTRFSEDATKFKITYDGNAVPYIPYQEYGFRHYISKKLITINQGFIRNNTVNDLNHLINVSSTNEKRRIMKHHERTNLGRERAMLDKGNMMSQGTLQSLKGNKR